MKKFLMISAAVLALGYTQAAFAVTANDLVTAYQNDGFTSIEVTTGPTQIKVEAVKAGAKIEVVYDIESGSILKQETSTVTGSDATGSGVEIKTTTSDFTGEDGEDEDGHHSGTSDDGAGHDAGDDNGSDDQGDDNGSDHGSDHGGSGNGGSGNSGSGNSGSGHGGSDHDGGDNDED